LLQGDIAITAKELFQSIAAEKGIVLHECEAVIDHAHLLLDSADRPQLARTMHLLKGVSAKRLFEVYPDLKLDASTLHFWQKGYGAKVVPESRMPMTRKYIQTQWERLESFDKPNRLKA
jgi:putative transposase